MAWYRNHEGSLEVSEEGLHVTDGPVWKDECHHGEETYVGTLEHDGELHDVYVHDQQGMQHVCVRYGNSGGEYLSCGAILDVFRIGEVNHSKLYAKVFALISARGPIRWTRGTQE